MGNTVYLTHKEQALGQTWFEISLEPKECEDIGVPFVPIDRNYLDRIAPSYFNCKTAEDLKRLGDSKNSIGRFDEYDEILWKNHIAIPYRRNLERAKEIIVDTPTDKESGLVADISRLRDGDINVGGCYLDYCLSDTIESLRSKLKNQKRRMFIVPELTVCFMQPGNFTFKESLSKLNSSSEEKLEIKHLDELLERI
jgi:hypothetical protein